MSNLNAMAKWRARQKAKQPTGGGQDPAFYPFWDLNFGQNATFRFLPFEDEVTDSFWVTRKTLPMEFVDPSNDGKTLKYNAPCLEMYEHASANVKCPVANEVRALFKEAKAKKSSGSSEADDLEKVALKHWIKYKHYFQGFVIQNPLNEESAPENPIRIFPWTQSIYKVIFNSLMDDTDPMDALPTGVFDMDDINALLNDKVEDMDDLAERLTGRNFILRKTKQGEFANYSTSSWASQTSMLTDEQIQALGDYGLHDLRSKLPQRPTDEQYEVLTTMMQVSIDYALGQGDGLWDPEWETVGIKPFRERGEGGDSEEGGSSSKASAKKGDLKSRLQKNLKGGGEEEKKESTSAASVREKLGRGRVKAQEADDAEPAPGEDSEYSSDVDEVMGSGGEEATTESEAPKPSDNKSRISALSARINKRTETAA